MKFVKIFAAAVLTGALLVSCGVPEEQDQTAYQRISMEEAAKLMESESDYMILDVRTQEEYDEGHIPGAVLVENDSIGTEEIPELPDKNQKIFVYCRSGNRSRQAAEKLVKLGYTDIVEIGGIRDWKGEVESKE